MTDWVDLDFDPGPWGTVSRGPNRDLEDLTSNLDLVRMHFKSDTAINESNVIRGVIWINAASSTWIVNLSDGNDWIQLFAIDTIAGQVVYPGGYISADSIPDGTINTYHVKDGELDSRTIAQEALREHHPASGTLIRNHVASGAVLLDNIKTKVLTGKHFSDSCVSGDKVDKHAFNVGTTGTEYEYKVFNFGFPDIKGGYINAKTGGDSCGFGQSQIGKTGFKIKSSTSTALRVIGYVQESA